MAVCQKKSAAETSLLKAQTRFTGIEVYSTMLNDLRTQINMQGEQLKNQAKQILSLEQKEDEYVKIIKNSQLRERRCNSKIKELEKALKESQELLNELQIKLKVP